MESNAPMESISPNMGQMAASKRFALRLITMGENRLELLMVEVQEERVRLLRAILLALGVVAFGFLAGAMLTGVAVVLFWAISPIAVLLILACLYTVAAVILYRQLSALLRGWESLPATLDQLRKDRICLEEILA
jgi:uncharacterized membrane protein YqjE